MDGAMTAARVADESERRTRSVPCSHTHDLGRDRPGWRS
jgi:hypothetical protein